MTDQEKLLNMWVDSELRKTVETQRSKIGNLIGYLRDLRTRNPKMFDRIVELNLISEQELEEAKKS